MARCGSKLHVGNRLLPITEFHKNKDKKNGHHPHCKACRRIVTKAYRDKLLANPETAKAFREKQRKSVKDWDKRYPEKRKKIAARYRQRHLEEVRRKEREKARRYKLEHPEKIEESRKKRREKLRADPVAWQRFLEDQRMYRRLREERKGRDLDSIKKAKVKWNQDPRVMVDAQPFREFLAPYVTQYGIGYIAKAAGADPSRMQRVYSGEYKRVTIAVVDKVLHALDGPPYQSLYPDLD